MWEVEVRGTRGGGVEYDMEAGETSLASHTIDVESLGDLHLCTASLKRGSSLLISMNDGTCLGGVGGGVIVETSKGVQLTRRTRPGEGV